MLYTGRGDNGTTRTFGCDQRISKSSAVAEALGAVDETNSLLGVLKMEGRQTPSVSGLDYHALLSGVQQDLFVIQAELAGADKTMEHARVKKLEDWVNAIEKELPPISSFFVSGGTKLGALCDYARTVSRRAERRVVACLSEDPSACGHARADACLRATHRQARSQAALENDPAKDNHKDLLAYMNRLSSLLYALARLANHRAGVAEEKPRY